MDLKVIAPDNCNEETKQSIKSEYENFWWQVLSYLEIVFAHKKGDDSENEHRYLAIRSRILRIGNDKLRNLDKLFESHVIFRLFESRLEKNENIEKQVIDFKNKWVTVKKERTKMETQTRKTEKIVEIGSKKYKLLYPSLSQSREADMEFSKSYTQSLKQGLMPRFAMENLYESQGVWTEREKNNLKDANQKMRDALYLYRTFTDEKDKLAEKTRYDDALSQAVKLSVQERALFSSCAEGVAEETKMFNLFWKCSMNEDGTKIWNNETDFFADKDTGWIGELLQSFIMFYRNIDEQMTQISNFFTEEKKEDLVEKVEVTV